MRMSFDMSGPMGGMPVGTTLNVQVAYYYLPAGERVNKTSFLFGWSTTPGQVWRGCGDPAPAP